MKGTPIFEEVFMVLLRQPGIRIKLIIGGLLSFIPGINIFAFGYLYRFSRRVRKSGEINLADWSDWKGLFKDGLRFAVVWLCYWLLPLLVVLGVSSLLACLGLGALAYILFSAAFLIAPILFASALYRYLMRSDFKDLLDISLIIKMTYLEFPRFLLPSIAFSGICILLLPLYGLALFFAFLMLIAFTGLCYRRLEYQDSASGF